jgi:hypothetical protein
MTKSQGFGCAICGGKEVCFGYLGTAGTNFVPSGTFTISGFRIRSYVCLNCGHIWQYLPQDKVEKLREKFTGEDDEE